MFVCINRLRAGRHEMSKLVNRLEIGRRKTGAAFPVPKHSSLFVHGIIIELTNTDKSNSKGLQLQVMKLQPASLHRFHKYYTDGSCLVLQPCHNFTYSLTF